MSAALSVRGLSVRLGGRPVLQGIDLVRAVRELRAQGIGVQALVSVPAPALRQALGAGHCWPFTPGAWGTALARALATRKG